MCGRGELGAGCGSGVCCRTTGSFGAWCWAEGSFGKGGGSPPGSGNCGGGEAAPAADGSSGVLEEGLSRYAGTSTSTVARVKPRERCKMLVAVTARQTAEKTNEPLLGVQMVSWWEVRAGEEPRPKLPRGSPEDGASLLQARWPCPLLQLTAITLPPPLPPAPFASFLHSPLATSLLRSLLSCADTASMPAPAPLHKHWSKRFKQVDEMRSVAPSSPKSACVSSSRVVARTGKVRRASKGSRGSKPSGGEADAEEDS
eukprot:1161081-Pelagomonas_calceolata.AAC.7